MTETDIDGLERIWKKHKEIYEQTTKQVLNEVHDGVQTLHNIISMCKQDIDRLRKTTDGDTIHPSVESAVKGHQETIIKCLDLLKKIQTGDSEFQGDITQIAGQIAQKKKRISDDKV